MGRGFGRRVMLGACASAVLLVTSCTDGARIARSDLAAEADVSEVDSPEGEDTQRAALPDYLQGVQFSRDEERAAYVEYDSMRNTDPCALQDPAAASASVDAAVGELAPGERSNECALYAGGPMRSDWTLRTSTGVALPQDARESMTTVEIGGREYYKLQDAKYCTYNFVPPGNDLLSYELTVSATDDVPDADKRVCGAGEQYLERVGDIWADHPQRGDGSVEPAFMLGTRDPCELVPDIRRAVPEPENTTETVVSSGEGGAKCRVDDTVQAPDDGSVSSPTRGSVDFAVDYDPGSTKPDSEIRKTTIAGQPAEINPPNPEYENAQCRVHVRFGDTLLPASKPHYTQAQVVRIGAPECAQGEELAAAAIEKFQK